MCGRFVQKSPPNQIGAFFDIKGVIPNFSQRFNVAPTQDAAVIVAHKDGRHLEIKKWDLIPFWSKEGKSSYSTFNARAESVREKPSFKQAFATRRCVVPADGFYEWTGPKGDKVPHLFERRDGALLALAGLFDTWKSKDGPELVHSFTIIVTDANRWMSSFHDRMPVILEQRDVAAWLSGSPDEAAALMKAANDNALKERVVSKLVNSVKNEGPELLEPA